MAIQIPRIQAIKHLSINRRWLRRRLRIASVNSVMILNYSRARFATHCRTPHNKRTMRVTDMKRTGRTALRMPEAPRIVGRATGRAVISIADTILFGVGIIDVRCVLIALDLVCRRGDDVSKCLHALRAWIQYWMRSCMQLPLSIQFNSLSRDIHRV